MYVYLHMNVVHIKLLRTFGYFGSLQCEFERRKPDGTTTLGLLHPQDPIVGGEFTDHTVHELAGSQAVTWVTF